MIITAEDFLLEVAHTYKKDYMEIIEELAGFTKSDHDDNSFLTECVPYFSKLLELSTDDVYKMVLILQEMPGSMYEKRSWHPWDNTRFNLSGLIEALPKFTIWEIMKDPDHKFRDGLESLLCPHHEQDGNTLISCYGNGKTELACTDENENTYYVRYSFCNDGMEAQMLYHHRYTDQKVLCWSSTISKWFHVKPSHIEVRHNKEKLFIPICSTVDYQGQVVHGELNEQAIELLHKEWSVIK